MNGTEYIAQMIGDGLLDEMHHSDFVECGTDINCETCHAIVCVQTNDCAALIEVLQRCLPFGVIMVALHHLGGKFRGCIECDLQLMPRRTRKQPPSSREYQAEL